MGDVLEEAIEIVGKTDEDAEAAKRAFQQRQDDEKRRRAGADGNVHDLEVVARLEDAPDDLLGFAQRRRRRRAGGAPQEVHRFGCCARIGARCCSCESHRRLRAARAFAS